MRKYMVVVCLAVLVVFCTVLCPVQAIEIGDVIIDDNMIVYYDSYEGYEKYIFSQDLPEGFISYEQISFLGEFQAYFTDSKYYVRDANGFILEFKNNSFEEHGDADAYHIRNTEIEFLNKTAVKGNAIFETNGAKYYYTDGNLTRIKISKEDAYNSCFEIRFAADNKPKYDTTLIGGTYPSDGKETFMWRLLNLETASAAIEEFRARLNGTYVEPVPEPEPTPAWVLPTAICGGAVLLVAAVAVPTVILRRKKRKAAAAADGDATDADANNDVAPIDADIAPPDAPDM